MQVEQLRLLGGRLCIDFVNTVENRAGGQPQELLTSYVALVRWAAHAGLLDDGELAGLLVLAEKDADTATDVLARALELRETLHRIFRAIAAGKVPDAADLELVKRAYAEAVSAAGLLPEGGLFGWALRPAEPRLEQPLWPVAFSAVELLTAGDLRRVKVCANPHGCGWLFYDGSKNASRRWCSMEGCGSQIKMRRHYARRKQRQANDGASTT